MANQEHLDILKQGSHVWNEWRRQHEEILPDLCGVDLSGADLTKVNFSGADLREANLCGANLTNANLSNADLRRAYLNVANLMGADLSETNFSQADLISAILFKADLREANFSEANLLRATIRESLLSGVNFIRTNLREADLSGADLSQVTFVKTNLCNTNLTGCFIYGISAWDNHLEGTKQSDLVITPYGEPVITVDNLEVAQFIYLLLNNQKIRDVINTIGQKGVLILGRFSQERKPVLDALREKLRSLNFLPIVFDFERPRERDFTETIMTLVGMSCFVIADITNPKSSPLELQATVPNYMIPFVPIIHEGEQPFSMFRDLRGKYNWVLDTLMYDTTSNLINGLEMAVVKPALEKRDELLATKIEQLRTRHIGDFL